MKVLLVSPKFYGYWASIAAALEHLGHEVTAYRYDGGSPRLTFQNALAYRVRAARDCARGYVTEDAIRTLRRVQPDAVLVIRGDSLGQAWWDAVAQSGAHTAIWMYDELTRMTYSIPTLAAVDSVFSYSPRDVATLASHGIKAVELPDAFDSLTPFVPREIDAVTFIGARYEGRERTLRALRDRGVPIVAFGREWSRWPWDIARTGRVHGPGVPARRDIGRAEYYAVMAGSLATLNIHGDGHDGFSMRTFEASGVGGLQLIDRPDVSVHYDVGTEVLVYQSDAELVDHVEHARRDPEWSRRIREAGRRRTLAEHTLVHRMREVQRAWD